MPTAPSTPSLLPFQCPRCFVVFSLDKNQSHFQGSCPACGASLTLSPSEHPDDLLNQDLGELEKPAAKEPVLSPEGDRATSLKTKAISKAFEPQSTQGRAQRKGDKISWERSSQPKKRTKISWLMIFHWGLLSVVFLSLGVYYMRNIATIQLEQEEVSLMPELPLSEPEVDVSALEEPSKKPLESDRFDLVKISSLLQKFLNSETITERAKYIRLSDQTLPLMKEFYQGSSIQPEGFIRLDDKQSRVRDGFFYCFAQTKSLVWKLCIIEEIDGRYLIDWESWVGYNEVPIQEMVSQKITRPVQVRAVLSPSEYYNYDFSDDQQWDSFTLFFPHENLQISAYVDRNSELQKKIQFMLSQKKRAPGIFLIQYPENAQTDDQVIISDVLSDSWVLKK